MATWWTYAKETGFEVAKLEAIQEQLREFYMKVQESGSKAVIDKTISKVASTLSSARSRYSDATAKAEQGAAVPSNIDAMIAESQKRQFEYDKQYDSCLSAVTEYETEGRVNESLIGQIGNAIETVTKTTMGFGVLLLLLAVAYFFIKGR